MIEAGLWTSRKQRCVFHQPRLRRERLGELIQINGRGHRWFEDRGEAISPGPIETPILGSFPKEVSDQIKNRVLSMVPANELGHTEDIAKAASFLASYEGRYIRGIELFVDGGMVCS